MIGLTEMAVLKKIMTIKISRLILVKFVCYAVRRIIFSNERRLKYKNISISERLTNERMTKLKETK